MQCKEPPWGSSPKLARGLRSGVVSLGPLIGHLLIVLLLQHGIELLHSLLLLQLPLLLLQPLVRRCLRLTIRVELVEVIPWSRSHAITSLLPKQWEWPLAISLPMPFAGVDPS
jgi:hypothetical protein